MDFPVFYDCPACGAPQSSDGEHFCGKCEANYRAEQERLANDEIQQLHAELNACPCQDEGCGTCHRRRARILSLQGKEEQAIAMLNA